MMRKRLWIGFVILAGAAQSQAYREGDSQLWVNLGGETVVQKVRMGVDTGARFGDSMSDYFYQTYEPYMVWSGVSWLDVGLACEFITQKKNGDWLDEQVPKLNVTIKGAAGPLQLSNRSRMEYRFREGSVDEWRYRDRVRLQLAKGVTEYKLRPFIEDEVYFSLEEKEFNENRASAGFGFELTKWLKGELYYMARSTYKDEEWTDSNIVGTKLSVIF